MASYFQSYLQASSMPKRLLQYALSRLEILDTSALGLDNLDIAWGKNSEFVFKDVGLRLRKLENLLQLPPSFEFSKAKVILLRVTIPVDIYSSPILVEVEGVECHLRVQADKSGNTTSPLSLNQDRQRKKRSRSHTRLAGARRGSEQLEDENEDADAILPTAADLAQSFLQTEPRKEKEELEAAILSDVPDLAASVAMSDDGDEDEAGTGTALSLPAFMTKFLQGIVDRLQVKIHGITMNLEVDVPNETVQPISVDPVTVQLRIDSVDIEGVTQQIETLAPDGTGPALKEGKRLVCLSKIRGALITEANLFSSLARSSALSSPSVAHSEVFHSQKASSRFSSARGGELAAFHTPSPERVSLASSRRLSIASELNKSELQASRVISPEQTSRSLSRNRSFTSESDNNEPERLHGSVIASDSGRFDDASEYGTGSDGSDNEPPDDLLISDMRESTLQDQGYLDHLSESQFLDPPDGLGDSQESLPRNAPFRIDTFSNSPLSTPRAETNLSLDGNSSYFASRGGSERRTDPMLYSSALPRTRTRFLSQSQGVSRSQPLMTDSLILEPLQPFGSRTSPIIDNVESSSLFGASSHTEYSSMHEDEDEDEDGLTPIGEDLADSKIFSHEEAESMYMSALSQGLAGVPGGWAHSDDGNDAAKSSTSTPKMHDTSEEPLDNLEHALQKVHESRAAEEEPAIRSPSPTPSPSVSSPIHSFHTPPLPQKGSSASEQSNTSSEDYGRMTKQILNLDLIAIYLPSARGTTEPASESSDLAYGSEYGSTMFSTTLDSQKDSSFSIAPGIPGAFSVHSERRKGPQPRRTPIPQAPKVSPMPSYDDSIEIDVGDLSLQFDVSVGRLLWMLLRKVQENLKQEQSSTGSTTSSSEVTKPRPDLKVNAKNVSLKFLERLEGKVGSVNVLTEMWESPPQADTLLQTSLKGLSITSSVLGTLKKTAVTLQKFAFGYAHEDIVSFNADLQMRASVRDLAASAGVDVTMALYQTPDTTRCEISTLPLHVSIDLQRLDETFSWFGGLSSVLNMGSSVVSNATVTTTPVKPKSRGVRFETPIKPDDRSVAAQNKVDARIGGFILDLIGKECSIGAETSAVKIVSREEGLGLSISKIRLSGPHLRMANKQPAITADITATRIEFLPSPKDVDLDRLLALITPSKAKYDQDDDILLDTLLRQRKQGAVLRLTVDEFKTKISKLDELSYLPELGEEIGRLSTVAKYLPDDDRPGLLSLITVHNFGTNVDIGKDIGVIQLAATEIEVAQISLPSLIAFSINTVTAHRNGSEELLGDATDAEAREPRARAPAIMARMIGDEMEPIIKLKLWNLRIEYRVPTLMALLGLADDSSPEDLSASMVASVATLTGLAQSRMQGDTRLPSRPTGPDPSPNSMTVDVVIRDCILGLNPLGLPSKVLVVLSESHLSAVLPKDQNTNAKVEIGKASVLIIDNVANISSTTPTNRPRRESFDGGNNQVADLCGSGFVSVGYISSAKAGIQVTNADGERSVEVELRDDLFVLESCADSTQTLVAALTGLSPPTPPSKEIKYRTKVIPVEDLLASLSGDAFANSEGGFDFDDEFGDVAGLDKGSHDGLEDFDFESNYIDDNGQDEYQEAVHESEYGARSLASQQLSSRDTHDGVLLESMTETSDETETGPLEFQDDHFEVGPVLEGTAHQWNSAKNKYDRSNTGKVHRSPLKVFVRDVHLIWNLFDGYDWQHTRDTISKAVQEVESKAIEKRARNDRRPTFDQDIDDEETVIGDFLFNSIYIGIPANRDPRELSAAINQGLNDDATETESIATTTYSSSPSRAGGPRRPKAKRLRLRRSKHHKITFELKGVSVDLVAFPPGSGETQSSIDVRVHDFDIFDHIPTSTWRKFATYMHDAGERETGASQIHIEILNVKPVPELAAAEIVLKATVLPLRLHVDQDALDFITRFFEFKDDSAVKSAAPSDEPFLQRVEVNSVQVKLDFKPKRVDYAGLRSGHTTEFMNFLILDEADMVLRHTIIYGISGFEKLGKCLNDIWMPEIKRNQLPGILAGIAPVRSLVNVGGGLQQLFIVPMHEYQKDGRIVRSMTKGATAFAKTTGSEIVKLGAKMAIGMQAVLQGAEELLGPGTGPSTTALDDDETEEENKQISLYANQPVGVFQGLRGGYAGLKRDLHMATDAIIAVPGEVMEEGTAAGVLKAVRKHAPTVIFRPAIGVAKASGQILMGATNSMDPANLKRAGDKYKSY